jgi:signal transduction histidine kinase/HAMP domain-containing protein
MQLFLRLLTSRISTKITLPYLLLAVLLAVVTSALATDLTVRTLQDRLTNRLVEVGQSTSDALVAVEERQITQLRSMVFTEGVSEALLDGNAEQLASLLRPHWANNNLYTLAVFDAQGRVLIHWQRPADSRPSDPPIPVPGVALDTWWIVQQIVEGQEDTFGDKFSAFQGRNLYTAAPVRQQGRLLGGMLVGIPTDTLLMQLQSRSQASVTTLYNAESRAVATTQILVADSRVPAIPPESFSLLRGDSAVTAPFHTQSVVALNGRDYQFAYSPLIVRRSMSGFFSVALPRSFIVTAWTRQRVVLILVAGALVLAVIVVGTAVSHYITRPIKSLVQTARAVTRGALDQRSEIASRDEIGVLARSFNQMTERLLHLYETSRQMSTHATIEAIVARAVEAVHPLAPHATTALLLNDGGRWKLFLGDAASNNVFQRQTAIRDDLVVKALAKYSAQPVVAPADARRLRGLNLPADAVEVCYVALVASGDVIGLLLLLSPTPGRFREPLLAPFAAVASMTATALHNTQLYIAVQEEGARRRVILESIADGVLVCDAERNVVLMNPAAEALLKVRDWRQQPYPFAKLPLQPLSEHTLLHTGAAQVRYDVNGTVVSASSALLQIPGRPPAGEVIVLRNISAEVDLEQAKTDLIALISHELRTPLTAIQGAVEMMKQGIGGQLPPLQLEMVHIARRQTRVISGVIDEAILFTRIETGSLTCDLRSVQLHAAVHAAIGALHDTSDGAPVEVLVTIPDTIDAVTADPRLLELVLQQVIDNAIKYGGGTDVEVGAYQYGPTVTLEVRDSGPGIDEQELPTLFYGLRRGANSLGEEPRGLGLGLAISRALIERQGGTISVRSQAGKGTTVVITLQAAAEQDVKPALYGELQETRVSRQ